MKIRESVGRGYMSKAVKSLAGVRPGASILVRWIAVALLLLCAGMVVVQTRAGQSGTWTETGSLNIARHYPTATLLPNGKVLVAGGFNSFGGTTLTSAELYDPASGTWTATGTLNIARNYFAATLLPNGKVLVAGGYNEISGSLSSAELYDPASRTWTATSSLTAARNFSTMTLLPNGKVLVGGGYNEISGALSSAELYDPASGTWTTTGSLATARGNHTATLLANGKVLVAGGGNISIGYVLSAELYDPASGTWTATGSLATGRSGHTATLLPNGQVLVAGGLDNWNRALASAELYTSDGSGELTLVSAASRKTHGAKGDFDIDLPLTGDLGIECRSGLTRYAVVFTFNNNVTGADSATSSCGTIGSMSVDPIDAHNLIVTYNGATCDGETVTVTANNVHDDQGNTLASAAASMGLLIGDINGDGRVGNGDIGNIQAHNGERADSTNFRDDLTVDGRINNQDVQTARSHRGKSLP